MYLVKTPRLIDKIYPQRIWRMNTEEKVLYLTFDDGPIPEITPWILDRLKEFGVKATFFCVGENVQKNNEIYKRILKEGHVVGNHTQHHLNGSKTSTKTYVSNVETCTKYVDSKLFRPPYGRLDKEKEQQLLDRGFKIVMWDVLSGDFDPKVDTGRCIKNVLDHVDKGSIVVLHDNLKAIPTLKASLSILLKHLLDQGFEMKTLPD